MYVITVYTYNNSIKGKIIFEKSCKTLKTCQKYWHEAVSVTNKYNGMVWAQITKNNRLVVLQAG